MHKNYLIRLGLRGKYMIYMLVFAIVWLLAASAGLQAQELDKKISIHFHESSLANAIEEVRKVAGINFFYDPAQLAKYKTREQSFNGKAASAVIAALLEPAGFTYAYQDGSVLIKRKKGGAAEATLQNGNLHGTVTDTTGNVLAGVTVRAKEDSRAATATDQNGRFSLKVPEGTSSIIFSLIGFSDLEVRLRDLETYQDHFVLSSSQGNLDEVVVVAFGTQKKKELVGSMTTISPKDLKVPSSNLTTALAGRLAGMVAYQRSGEPGADNADFFIRGVTTFGYKVDPLILIDGIELSASDLSRLQVDDIATFSILKDATATALYGARGANGVILITTKEGVEGATKVSVRLENSISAPTRNVEVVDPVSYMRLNNEAVRTRNPQASVPYSNTKIDNTIAGINPYFYPETDWREMLFKDYTTNRRVNMNASGGGKVARYYLAATLNQDNGILNVDKRNNFNNNIDLKTYELRSNININLTKTTEVGVRMYGTFDDYNGPVQSGASLYKLAMRSDPVSFPAYYPADDEHQYAQHILFGNTSDLLSNPYAALVSGYREYNQSLLLAQFDLKQDLSFITKGLNLNGLFNVTRYAYSSTNRSYKPYWYEASAYNKLSDTFILNDLNPDDGTEYLDYSQPQPTVRSTTYIQATANYNRTFGQHGLSGLLVFLMQNQTDGNASSLQQSLPHRNIGLSGRFTYSLSEKYFAEFNFGYNGSERFYKTNRFGFFPSVGAAWSVSDEKFWKNLKPVINNFRLRGTYGLIGNDAIGSPTDRFFYLSDVSMDDPDKGAVFGLDNTYNRDGITVNRYSNPEISWEKSYKTNAGFDMGLFNKVNVILDLWNERRTHILMTRSSIPTTMGLPSSAIPKANVGQAKGKGIDFSIDYSHNLSNALWIQARANFTYATSSYLAYEEPVYANEPWKSRLGYNLSQQWGYIAERLFVDDEEVYNSPTQNFGEPTRGGDIKYRDVNGDGQITELDQVPIGYPTTPEIVYGFGTSVGFKNFDFSIFFQGLARESFWLDLTATSPFLQSSSGGLQLKNQMLQAYADDYWSEANPDPYALWPRLTTTGNQNNKQTSTWFMRNGAFLRLKNAEFGYTLPASMTRHIHLEKLRLYINGSNLLLWSPFKLWDVEMAGDGLGYPVQRVINLGAQISF